MERGAVARSQEGKKAYVERKVGERFQQKAHGQFSKGDSCSFSYTVVTVEKKRMSSPAPNSKAKTEEGRDKSSKTSGISVDSS